jgi:NADPH2:quinone reductase
VICPTNQSEPTAQNPLHFVSIGSEYDGAFAQYCLVPARHLHDVTRSALSDVEIGAMPCAYGTAANLLARAGVVAGERVLVTGASGGVGLAAIQIGKALGARVIAAASTAEKLAICKDNGADELINYATEDLRERLKEITGGKGVKVVYDSVGKDTWEKSLNCLAPFGLMASFGNASGAVAPFAPGILGAKGSIYVTRQTLFTHLSSRESAQTMADDLFAVVESGQVKIRIDQRYPLAEVAQAHRDLESRKTTGCTILLP